MQNTRREILGMMAASGLAAAQTKSGPAKYVRFQRGTSAAYGVLDGEMIAEIRGPLFGDHAVTGTWHKLSEARLLYPCEPPKLFAVGLNYKSHIGNRPAPKNPEIFYKPVTALLNPGDPIVIPKEAANVHFEGELVIVIGKRAANVTVEEASGAIFGFTCGNDVSERDWQNGPEKDLQWWRAKGSDTFAPLGPAILRTPDIGKRLLETRLNGKVMQKQFTTDLLFDPPAVVSWISQFVTLTPGDVIYTGTPGSTSRMSPGDVVEIEIEGIGVLRNPVTAES